MKPFMHLALFIPVLNHLTGTTQDLSAFENLKGNFGNLLFFLVLTWTLAAFGEEIVYRGYLQKRMCDLFVGPIYGFW
jgi:membrane protease YdiL (CAAX protease family)